MKQALTLRHKAGFRRRQGLFAVLRHRVRGGCDPFHRLLYACNRNEIREFATYKHISVSFVLGGGSLGKKTFTGNDRPCFYF